MSKRYDTLQYGIWSHDMGQTLDTNSCHVGTSDGCEGRNLHPVESTHLGVPVSSKSSSYSLTSVTAMVESRETASPVQLLFGLKKIPAIGEQIRAFLGNDGATCTQLSKFGGIWSNASSTGGSVESRDECPTLVTVGEIFAEVYRTRKSAIVSKRDWSVAHVDLRWG